MVRLDWFVSSSGTTNTFMCGSASSKATLNSSMTYGSSAIVSTIGRISRKSPSIRYSVPSFLSLLQRRPSIESTLVARLSCSIACSISAPSYPVITIVTTGYYYSRFSLINVPRSLVYHYSLRWVRRNPVPINVLVRLVPRVAQVSTEGCN